MNIEQLEIADPHEFQTLYEAWRDHEPFGDWWDSVFEMAVEDGAERGFNIDCATRRNANGKKFADPCIYFSGFWSQGDGASWVGHVDIPKWIEWMRAQRQRELDRGPCRPGNGTPFTDEQLLWIDEGYRNDMLQHRLHIAGDALNYSHSGAMHASDDELWEQVDDEEVAEGVFAGMHCDAFVSSFQEIVGDALFEEALRAARDFADEIYRNLEQEYEYLTSEEAFKQAMADEEYPDA